MFSCVFVTFPCGVLGQVWYLIVSSPELCLLPHFILSIYDQGVMLHVKFCEDVISFRRVIILY